MASDPPKSAEAQSMSQRLKQIGAELIDMGVDIEKRSDKKDCDDNGGLIEGED